MPYDLSVLERRGLAAWFLRARPPFSMWMTIRGVGPALVALGMTGCPSPDDDGAGWERVFENLDGALVSVWGTAHDDVWTVGSDPGDGMGPYLLHWDGASWERRMTNGTGDLWWVWTDGATLWSCGAAGLVVRHDIASATSEVLPTPTNLRLFGIYSFATNDVWAVGGDAQQQSGVVLRYDGNAWTEVDVTDVGDGISFYKVWGLTPNDVWLVGQGGAALHWDGSAFARLDVPAGRPLFTVHGAGDDVVAVGGVQTGHIVDVSAAMLANVTPAGVVPQLNGVWVGPDGRATAAGTGGAIWTREAQTWRADETAAMLIADLHSVYVDPEGDVWAVGGQILTEPLHDGVLIHHGEPIGEGTL